MPRKTTPSFVLQLGLETNAHDEAELNARFEAARQLYNACLDEAKRRLSKLSYAKTKSCVAFCRAFQRNYGRSVKDRAPGKFIEILRLDCESPVEAIRSKNLPPSGVQSFSISRIVPCCSIVCRS